jgi:hypothetical protein
MGMNINLSICDKDYKSHTDWDSIRQASDSDFPDFCRDLPKIDYPDHATYPFDDVLPFRPANFKLWRLAIRKSKLYQRSRYFKLMTLCEQNPDYWISFIY